MKSNTCLCIFISITISLNSLVVNGNLVEEVCAHTHNKHNCIASLETNPDSKQANLVQLCIIALRLASSNATDTSSYIKGLLLNRNTLQPAMEQVLDDCSDQYLDVASQLDDSLAALLNKAKDDVRTFLQAAIDDVESCENGLKGQTWDAAVELHNRNIMFKQLSNNALAINKILLAQHFNA